jgi:hypothetical protein
MSFINEQIFHEADIHRGTAPFADDAALFSMRFV